jgi:hypothetical protein
MKRISLLLFFVLANSCAFIYTGNSERELQTKIHAKITEKAPRFRQCALDSKLFTQLNNKRVRIVLFLEISPAGAVEKFKLDKTEYPEKFSNCIFNTIELIAFPKFDSHEILKIEQPFIFSKK